MLRIRWKLDVASWRFSERHFQTLAMLTGLLISALACRLVPHQPIAPWSQPPASVSIACGIPVVHLYGTPEEMGRQYARLLRAQVMLTLRYYLDPLVELRWDKQEAIKAALSMEKHIPADFIAELKAIAETLEVSYEEVLLGHTFVDLHRMILCSSFAVDGNGTKDGKLLVGRNLDFPSVDVIDKYGTLVVYHPDEGNTFVSVSFAGMAGVLSGMNEHGLVAAVMEVYYEKDTLEGMPYVILFRQLLQRCSTVPEAIEYLRRSKRTASNNLILADPSGDASMVEIEPGEIRVRPMEGGYVVGANHFATKGPADETWDQLIRTRERYDTLVELIKANYGNVDVEMARLFLNAVHQGNITLQSMVFIPETFELYLATGDPPSSDQPFVRFDAKALMDAPPLKPGKFPLLGNAN